VCLCLITERINDHDLKIERGKYEYGKNIPVENNKIICEFVTLIVLKMNCILSQNVHFIALIEADQFFKQQELYIFVKQ
jgi:hypothetical protein